MEKTNTEKKKLPAWLVLTIICVVAAGCLAVTNGITEGIIAENGQKAEIATRQKLLPSAAVFELNEENGVYTGKDSAGNPVGYVTTVKETGFGGEIEVTVAADPNGIIQGISVGGNNFSETAGLGAKSKDPAFQEQFKDKTAPVALSKDGGEIDAITSATITSKAVIRAVNTGMETIGAEAGFEIKKEETAIQTLGEGKYATTVQGFAGPVYVEVTLDENNMITEMSVGDESFSETPSFGGKTRDEAFRSQFIGKTGNIVLGDDVDAVSGATVTSKAVTGAVNSILLYVTDPDAYAAENAQVEESFERDELGIKVSASSQGMCGPVAVFMTVTDEGKIAKITIGDNDFCETEYFGELALEPEFYNQFIGMSLPVSMDDVDAISGATITTRAVVTAINDGYEKVMPSLGK
ncbi:MAG: hypothetical protein CW338_07485 [Clostridiales bacterium]|nr:hypothetical protein [Clostridiales bacterium]